MTELAPSRDTPWLCVGYYKDILYQYEKWGDNTRSLGSF